MPSTKDFRDRIKSVSNTAKVTGAMQMIAASKMTRAQNMVRGGRPYADRIRDVLGDLAALAAQDENTETVDLLKVRPVKKTLLLLVTPDRGLAGALVGNLQREAGKFIQEAEGEVSVIAVGRKGERFITRTGGDLLAGFSVPDRPVMDDTVTVGRMLVEEYRSERVDRVVLIYAQFISTAVQEVTIRQLLPVEPAQRGEGDVQKLHQLDYIYEPSISSVLQSLVPRYIETQVYHGILEAFASEHSARMIAMQNATDNAQEIVEGLTLDLNKARQESITAELLDIVGGVAALEG
ncbi:MAG: ATP synthase F1 subunit gamma [SAR202 cluster bacterium]|nr:MAG: ATP synthase F1 subunit gamma [SAR202 cluster bacterium]MBF06417.1 ATP synthase F1 subunit gamma [Chloroflexota bacterium]MCH2529597.1 ATP synthase F1 subunit gamma [Dehalococcoidia bacterium]KAA1299359.1 MAG: ATP synthase F1 subunit gamma [SAR202 cluster bacterium]KAA1302488.1 MAG: ATP synthase F1 subunit gamma [SAR202 cluster bacterium]